MKRLLCICIIVAIASTVLAFDELWQRAVEIQRNSATRVPGKIETTIKMPLSQGEVELVYSQRIDENNEIINELIYSDVKGVKDEKKRQKMLDDLQNKSSGSNSTININITEEDDESSEIVNELMSSDSLSVDNEEGEVEFKTSGESAEQLFLEKDINKISVKRLKKTKTINGIPCVAYDVTYSPTGIKEDTQSGRVWLNTTIGAPVYTELQIPSGSANAKIFQKTYFKYDESTNTNVTDSFTNTINISLFLIIRFKQETVIKYSEYFDHL